MKIKVVVCFIKIKIDIALIKNPKKGGIPPRDKILVNNLSLIFEWIFIVIICLIVKKL